MDRRVWAPALAVVIVIVAAAALALALAPQSWSIEYDTDGGTFPDDAPYSYTEGDAFDLPVPERDGYVFRGWYSGDAKVESVTPDTRGDLHLRAEWIPAVEHTVSYELDGGVLPEDSQHTFIGGVGMILPEPTRNGYVFAGWFEDPELTVPIVAVGTEVFDDITVYACWESGDMVGTGYVWDIIGTYYNGTIPHTMEGTVREEYIAERDGLFYHETTREIVYSWPDGSTTEYGTTGTWTRSWTQPMTYVGVEDACGYPCTVWETEDGERVWLYHLYLQVRVSLHDGDTDIVQELAETYRFEPDDVFIPSVTAEYPLTVEGIGEITIGDSLTLTAVGDGFTGWYSGGGLVSTDRTYTVDRMDPYIRLEARGADGYTVLDPGTTLDDLGLPDAAVVDDGGDPVSNDLSVLEPGLYTATAVRGTVTTYLEFFIDEVRSFSLEWDHQGSHHSVSLDLRYSDVYRYEYDNEFSGIRGSLGVKEYVQHYHTTDDATLEALMAQLRSQAVGMDRTEFAQFVLSFVQNMRYIDDQADTGQKDYWKFPMETLWDGGGDCEDSTILYDTLMLMEGYDVAFIMFQDHAMTGIALPVDGVSVSEDGVRYVFCETTGVFDMGLTSVGHYPGDVYFWCPLDARTT